MNNPLLFTDVYKLGHMQQYPEDTTKIYSYLHTRSDKKYSEIVMFGLQYLITNLCYWKPMELQINAWEFTKYYEAILGEMPQEVVNKMISLLKLGYWPLEIKAHLEGTILPGKSVLLTVTNTHPDFAWVVGFFESYFLHLWYPVTVASASRQYYQLVKLAAEVTCDDLSHLPYAVHDFGYRGVSSNESAAIGGAAHLLNFKGSDTLLALQLINDTYGEYENVAASVPASEHSVMCAYGRECELEAFERMLDLYPTGIVSIVCDTYNCFEAITVIAAKLKDRILSRDGKVVFRPDSGCPDLIINGDKNDDDASESAKKGLLQLLGEVFGYTINSKGFKVLNQKVGLIYGDGMYLDNFENILKRMALNGWASSNLVIGVGGLLLQSHSRDDLGMSMKATYIERGDKSYPIQKDPITDHSKKSYSGLLRVMPDFSVRENQTWGEESKTVLTTIFKDGKLFHEDTWIDILKRYNK